MEGSAVPRQIWVCWVKPVARPEGNEIILSFLSPSVEEELEKEYRGIVIHAREASLAVRAEAKDLYLSLVARIGTALCGSNLTLRQALARPGEASRWWYHPVAFKDCESDPTFQWIIAILTIRVVAEKYGLKDLVLVGAPGEVTEVLKSIFAVQERHTRQSYRVWWIWLHGFASRILYALTVLWQWIAVCRWTKVPKGSFDVVLSSFWDWSVWWDKQAQVLADRYFKCLPDELKWQGVSSIGWFAWFDPHSEPGKEGRRLKHVLAPLNGRDDIVILQSLLHPWDILRAVGDFYPLVTFLSICKRPAFREVFQEGGFDYYPLFSRRLMRGFLDASLPHCDLVALATERACCRYRPKVALSFLEHFPYSRAHYEGVRRARNSTICFAIQHASYSREKTFLFLHPAFEFRGEPDGCTVPHPDYVCVMGVLGQKLFLECGYPKGHVLLTGSPRYDYIGASFSDLLSSGQRERVRGSESIRLLIVSSLDVDLELEMVEAVCAAARDVSGTKLFLRNHPFRQIEQYPRFAPYQDQIELMHESLEEDLAQADLILFTYSTVAEEAFLRGKPVWQWLSLGFNGSALAEVVAIPRFGSVASLREALRDFHADPSRFLPGVEARQLALKQLFYQGDGGGVRRIAIACSVQMRRVPSSVRCNG